MNHKTVAAIEAGIRRTLGEGWVLKGVNEVRDFEGVKVRFEARTRRALVLADGAEGSIPLQVRGVWFDGEAEGDVRVCDEALHHPLTTVGLSAVEPAHEAEAAPPEAHH